MLCDICKKKEAVIHIQEISPEGKKTINLCNECAEKHQQKDPLLNFGNISFFDVLENIKNISADIMKQKKSVDKSPVCPKCGWDLSKMEDNNGLLGCVECYKVFSSVVDNAVENIHHSHVHAGKRPSGAIQEPLELKLEKIRKLEHDLQSAVANEEYERAAVLRDEIASLKKQSDKEVHQ